MHAPNPHHHSLTINSKPLNVHVGSFMLTKVFIEYQKCGEELLEKAGKLRRSADENTAREESGQRTRTICILLPMRT